jgi:signal transduction histidine kinase
MLGDGLPTAEFSAGGHLAAWKDSEGTMWFASAKGMVAIEARRTAPHKVPPLVTLERAIADDHPFDLSQLTAFGPGLSRLSFEFTGISFLAPQHLRFKYRLEGFDRDWIDAGSRRDAYYTNSPPGQYRFAVMARNRDGIWSPGDKSVSFRIRAHLYQAKWFRTLLLLAIAAMAYTLYRWCVNRVREEFQAVIAERNRIAREIHDTLAQGIVGVSLQLELAQRLMSTSAESAKEILEQSQTLVQESLNETRRAIWRLRSRSASEDTLPAKLSKAIAQSVRNNRLELKFQVQGAYRRLPAKIEDEILRIGQEAVMNVVRHADASHLQVSLVFNSKTAEMYVSDDGVGFAPDQFEPPRDGHFGLRGMRQRAEVINAKLNVATAVGMGTRIRLEVSLP